jgi:hypothetical protein
MKNREVLNLLAGINGIANLPADYQFVYAMAQNKKALERANEPLEETRKRMVDENAERNEEGDVIIIPNVGVKIKNQKEVDKAWNELMEQEMEVEIFKVKEEYLPKGMTTNQLAGILDLIDKE